MMKMFVAIVLFAAFALPAASQDVITLTAYEELLKSGASTDGMTKSVISNALLEVALVSYSKNKLRGVTTCGETCTFGKCHTPGCHCNKVLPVCLKYTLEDTNSAAVNPLLEEALVAFAKKGNLGGLDRED